MRGVFSDILCCAQSDIMPYGIVILKPYGFSDIIFASKTREANITCEANITERSSIQLAEGEYN